jgi:hypothetical protein
MEISTMGTIYKNATVTIATAMGNNVSHGFLGDRAPVKACKMPFYLANDLCGSISIMTKEWHYRPSDPLFT